MTVTKILEEVKEEMCTNYCKYTEECSEKLENDEEFECPLDRI